jgi:hypothetical protein
LGDGGGVVFDKLSLTKGGRSYKLAPAKGFERLSLRQAQPDKRRYELQVAVAQLSFFCVELLVHYFMFLVQGLIVV